MEVQERFRQTGDVDTVQKLAGYIRTCAAVIHLVGGKSGAVADKKDVADYLKAEPAFLEKHPELRTALGDCSDLTYTQWEAFIALHHGVSLFLYATDKAATAHEAHLDRLRLGRKYAAPITDPLTSSASSSAISAQSFRRCRSWNAKSHRHASSNTPPIFSSDAMPNSMPSTRCGTRAPT